MDHDELESMDEQGVYVDPGKMQCDAFYVQLRISIARRFGNSILSCNCHENILEQINIQNLNSRHGRTS